MVSDEEIHFELQATQDAIRALTGVAPRFWRPPHFDFDDRVRQIAADTGLGELVRCSIDPCDYAATAPEIVERVFEWLEPGAIVDLHDGRPASDGAHASSPTREATVAALAEILERLAELGYRAVTVSQLLGMA